MDNPIIQSQPKKRGNLGLTITGIILTIIGLAGNLILANFYPSTATSRAASPIEGLLALLILAALTVGIVFLSVFSPLRGRRILWLFFLSQIPLTLLSLFAPLNVQFHLFHNWTAIIIESLIFFAIVIPIGWLAYRAARKYDVIPPFSWSYFRWGRAAIGLILLLGSQFIINAIFALFYQATTTTSNQATLDSLAVQVPFLLYFVGTVSAGFFEELVFRVGSFEILLKNHKVWAYIVAAGAFTLAHGPNNLQAALTYGTMAIILTTFYLKYRNFYLNMTMHAMLNVVASLLFWLSLIGVLH